MTSGGRLLFFRAIPPIEASNIVERPDPDALPWTKWFTPETTGYILSGADEGTRAAAFKTDTPFLAVSARFDDIAPGDAFTDWCLASVLEQRQRLAAFSSYFLGEQALDSLEILRRLPFQCAGMQRRRQLMRIRFGQQRAPESTPLLAEQSDDNLNPEFWAGASSAAKSA